MQTEHMLIELSSALERFDERHADNMVVQLLRRIWEHQVSDDLAVSITKLLRHRRKFFAMSQVAGAVLAGGSHDARIKVALVQSVIDSGELATAESLLERFLQEHPDDDELLGLRGRTLKQLYVAGVAAGAAPAKLAPILQRSFESYLSAYRHDSELVWHGINAVALALRAQRDGLALAQQFDAVTEAQTIASIVKTRIERGNPDPWDYAVALESALALRRHDDAVVACSLYATYAGEFACASTLRQLREIWSVDETDPNRRMLTGLLEGKITTERRGAVVPISSGGTLPNDFEARSGLHDAVARSGLAASARKPRDCDVAGLEAVFDGALVALQSLRIGFSCAESVAWIARPSGRKQGTGFLVPGHWLHASLGSEPVLLTNSHVLDDRDNGVGEPLRPRSARIGFETGPNCDTVFTVYDDALIWRSPPHDLDTVVMRLHPAPARPLPAFAPRLPSLSEKPHVFVIGHAGGRELSYSMMDNLLLDYDGRVFHYRAPTQPGSSGSPVFNLDWELLAIHHAGHEHVSCLNGKVGSYQANEGIGIEAIRAELSKQISSRLEQA